MTTLNIGIAAQLMAVTLLAVGDVAGVGSDVPYWGALGALIAIVGWTMRRLVNEVCRRGAVNAKLVDRLCRAECVLRDPDALKELRRSQEPERQEPEL